MKQDAERSQPTDPMPGVTDIAAVKIALHAEISRRQSLEKLVLQACDRLDKLEAESNAKQS